MAAKFKGRAKKAKNGKTVSFGQCAFLIWWIETELGGFERTNVQHITHLIRLTKVCIPLEHKEYLKGKGAGVGLA